MVKLNYQSVLDNLKEGNERFINGQTIKCSYASLLKIKTSAVNGQFPKAVILCCSDARAPAEFVFDQDIGDLFVIRIAGNIVTEEVLGSVEFAVQAFATSLVVVMGHTSCGAVSEALKSCCLNKQDYSKNLLQIIETIKPNIEKFTASDISPEIIDQAVCYNVKASVKEIITKSPRITQLISEDKLAVYGSILDLKSGKVTFFPNATI